MQIWRYARLLAIAALGAMPGCDDPADPAPPTGSLQLSISGLPDTIDASISLTGPNGFSATIPTSRTMSALVPGTYTISASRVVTSIATFVPAFESQQVTVGARAVSQAAVIYSVTTGSIAIAVSGVPTDVPWAIQVTGPGGYRDSVSASKTLGNLAPGIYTISAGEVQRGLSVYAPRTAEFVLTIAASVTPTQASVVYQLITGTLAVHVNGLPAGTTASVAVSGPAGYTLSATTTLEGLRQGRYVITATPVGAGASLRNPAPASQNVAVIAGSVAVASVNYWDPQPAPGLNLTIDAVQLQQVVQTYGGAVPAIAGRDAVLRVFVRASEPNAAAPAVRVRLFDGLQLIATHTIAAPSTAVPTAIDEGQLAASWNLSLPASVVRPGLGVLADVDPANGVAESAENDNAWPSSGTPLALDVRATTPLAVRIVPISLPASGLTGNVTAANIGQYEAAARQLLPLATLTTELRPTFTSNAPPLQPNDANGAWARVLSEVNALRVAEGSQAHYYGVVKIPYSAGVVGISYLPSFAAIGFDSLPKAAPTFVHELGHHFGRLHAPACGAGGYDANFPYPGGAIGGYGFDAATMTLHPPTTTDIMGYCDGRWISDYTYTGILAFRAAQASAAASMTAGTSPRGLLLWGRIGPGGPVLEPAFEVDVPARLPTEAGPYRLEVLDEAGGIIWTARFRGDRTIDLPSNGDHFAFVVPNEALEGRVPARIRLTASSGRSELATSTAGTASQFVQAFAVDVRQVSTGRMRISWRNAPGRGVLVRDSRTGAILALGRGGSLDLKSGAQQLDLTLSDGVRSVRRSLQPR